MDKRGIILNLLESLMGKEPSEMLRGFKEIFWTEYRKTLEEQDIDIIINSMVSILSVDRGYTKYLQLCLLPRPVLIDIGVACLHKAGREMSLVVLSNLIPVCPKILLDIAIEHWRCSPCPFEFLGHLSNVSGYKPETEYYERVFSIVEAVWKLLRFFPQGLPLLKEWDWSLFFPYCHHPDKKLASFAAMITARVLGLADGARQILLGAFALCEISSELQLINEYTTKKMQLAVTSSPYCTSSELWGETSLHSDPQTLFLEANTSTLVRVAGVALQKRPAVLNNELRKGPGLVMTPTTYRNLHRAAVGLSTSKPVLLQGPTGCGKSALIHELARLTNNTGFLEIHLDDQTDSKSLFGSYVCADVPGEFYWQPGVLTQAVLAGKWVLIEDVDRSPAEVLAALLPLLECNRLPSPDAPSGYSQPSPGFRLFGTITTPENGETGGWALGSAGAVFNYQTQWHVVPIKALPDKEILEIALSTFKGIPQTVLEKIMTMFQIVTVGNGQRVEQHLENGSYLKIKSGRRVSVRDLFKLCARVEQTAVLGFENDYLPEIQRLALVEEATRILVAHSPLEQDLIDAVVLFSRLLELHGELAIAHCLKRKIEITVTQMALNIGHTTIPRSSQQLPKSSSFAVTGHASRLLASLAAGITCNEPILLVGETGCGKTTLVQQIASSLGIKLIVQNMSLQTDGTDLLGGYRPVEISRVARNLVESFLDLFPRVFFCKEKHSVYFCNYRFF